MTELYELFNIQEVKEPIKSISFLVQQNYLSVMKKILKYEINYGRH